jgi:sugar/nucleoside kinase (ribokinase family)
MGERRGILAGGNWIVDRLKVIDTYPCQDTLANIYTESTANGGSPFNVLVDLARLAVGVPLSAVGLVGADADGEWIRSECASHGIDTAQLRTQSGLRTSYTDVMTVRDTGRRTFFHQRGANAQLEDSHFDFSATPARHFQLGYLLLLDSLDQSDVEFGTMAARTLHRAQQCGLTTSIDVVSEDSQRFPCIVVPALRYVDYCFLNEFELERTTNLRIRGEHGVDLLALQAGAERLLDAGVRQWVIVHFPEGVCALGGDGRLRARGSVSVPQDKIVSTVGAGDAFAAGALHALHDNAPIETVLRYGTCAAAACLQGRGASDGIGELRDCLLLEERFGVRDLS